MTENEKLRALLAEARGTMRDFAENWDCDTDAHKYGTTCRVCDAGAMKESIDAALAEPAQTEAEKLLAQLGKLGKCESGRKGHSSDCGCAPCREGFRLLDKFNTARAMGEVNAMTALEKAQAEVERLTAELDMVDSDLQLAVKRLTAECERLRKERDAACMAAGEYSQDEVNAMTTAMIAVRKAAERAAYQRGAEAMREAAAKAIPGHYSGDIIRALPLPEGDSDAE